MVLNVLDKSTNIPKAIKINILKVILKKFKWSTYSNNLSTSSHIACFLEYLAQNKIAFHIVIHNYLDVFITCFRIFEKCSRTNTGLLFVSSFSLPNLDIGVNLAIFIFSENIPNLTELLTLCAI